MAILDIGEDFSKDPQGRFRSDSNSSGEAFREDVLLPALQNLGAGEKLIIVLDTGVESYGSSFLTEGFAGVVKYGYYQASDVLSRLEFQYSDEDFSFFRDKIIKYCNEAVFNSKRYVPNVNKGPQ